MRFTTPEGRSYIAVPTAQKPTLDEAVRAFRRHLCDELITIWGVEAWRARLDSLASEVGYAYMRERDAG